jgi:predicted DNA-binding transcriptional regulator YafY
MPINKDARIRYEILEECLRDTKRKWTRTSLLNFVNRRLDLQFGKEAISASQLRYDLEAMEVDLGAPIEKISKGRTYYYRYGDPEFSINSLPITEEDIHKLASAVQLLKQIQGFTIADEIEDVVYRLERRSKYRESGLDGPVILFEDSPPAFGIGHLEDIHQAILSRTPLKISYRTFRDDEPREFHLHPYVLKEYLHRWYLVGWCEEKETIIRLALDRMFDIRTSSHQYVPNRFFNPEVYFSNVIGVTVYADQQPETVELLFSPTLAPYLLTKPMHRSQEVVRQYDDGTLYVKLRLCLNPELTVLLQGYGDGVKVIGPASLVETMKQTAAAVLKQYEVG